MVQRTQLIVRDAARWVQEIAIELARLHAEHMTGVGCVAGETILRAGIKPGLCAGATRRENREVLVSRITQQISVALIVAPFVSESIHSAIGVANEQPRFKALTQTWIRIVRAQLEMFHEHCALRKTPFARGRERNLFVRRVRRAVVRHGQPTRFEGAVRPERRVHRVRNQRDRWREVGRVRKCAGLREHRRGEHRGRASARELPDFAARTHLQRVNFSARIQAERCQSPV